MCGLAELFEGGFEVFHGFLGEKVGIDKIVGFFQPFVSAPEDIEARLIAVNKFLVLAAGSDRPL